MSNTTDESNDPKCSSSHTSFTKEDNFELKVGAGYTVYEHPYSTINRTIPSGSSDINAAPFPNSAVVGELEAKVREAERRVAAKDEEISRLKAEVADLEQDLRVVVKEERALARSKVNSLKLEHEKELAALKLKIKRLRGQRKASERGMRAADIVDEKPWWPSGISRSNKLSPFRRAEKKPFFQEDAERRRKADRAEDTIETQLETRFPNLWLYEAEATQY